MLRQYLSICQPESIHGWPHGRWNPEDGVDHDIVKRLLLMRWTDPDLGKVNTREITVLHFTAHWSLDKQLQVNQIE
ncbi:unnamed protein product [Protopolystoma xenopodis]|uniref:Uncharacterized protein n=1 Tax=Protopolystoma xenopodis TaxID=117903 RepID=A0A448WBY9_9PLAT|nr:unnamed protein product [Protopolystoma xenopodis]